MRLKGKHKPHFSMRELGLLFGIALALVLSLVPMKVATSSVIKMPKPLPDIIKSHKSVYVHAGWFGMSNSGVQVKQGDYITILAKGTIDLHPAYRGAYMYGPKVLLSYRLSKGGSVQRYQGPEIIAITESGNIYLDYAPITTATPGTLAHTGFFYVDIIVWKTNDPNLMAKFLEEASLSQPKDKELKEMAQEFKKRQEIAVALQKKSKEVEEIKKELLVAEAKETPAVKK